MKRSHLEEKEEMASKVVNRGDAMKTASRFFRGLRGGALILLMAFTLGHGAVAHAVTLTFDEVDASAGPVDATGYLAGFGITLSDVTPGTGVVITDRTPPSHVAPPSLPNTLDQSSQVGQIPVSYTLNFSNPQDSVSFTRPKLLTGPSGVTHPQWSARAFDSQGVELASVGEALIASFSDVPPETFTLLGPGIKRIRFDSNNFQFASTVSVVIDDLTFSQVRGGWRTP